MEIFKVFGSIFLKGSDDVKKDLKDIDNTAKKSTGFSSLGEKVSDFSKNAGSKLGDFAKNVGKVAIGVGASIGTLAIAFGTLGVKGALELEATQAKFATVFGEFQEQANETYNQISKLTPMTKAQFNSMSSGIQDLLVPMGLSREEATGLTGDTMHLVGALTNFNSATHSAEDVSGAFQSALTGNTEGLKRLGIQVNAETINQKAYEMGLVDAGAEVDAASKAQALMAIAYEQSGDALAAYNEESLDTKTKIELLKTQVGEFATGLAEKLLPAIMGLVDMAFPLLIDIMDAVAPVFEFLIQNVLPPLVQLLETMLPIITDLTERFISWGVDALQTIIPIIQELFQNSLPYIESFFATIETLFNFIIENKDIIIAGIVGITTSLLVFKTITFITAVVDGIKALAAATDLAAIKQAVLNTVMAANPIVLIVSLIAGLVVAIITLYNTNDDFKAKVDEVWSFIKAIFTETIGIIVEAITGFVTETKTQFTNFYDSTKEKVDGVINVIKTILTPVVEGLATIFQNTFDKIKEFLGVWEKNITITIDTVKGVFGGITEFLEGAFTGDWKRAWNGVVSIFENIFGGVKGIGKNIINGLISPINSFINGLNRIKIPDWVAGIGGSGINIPTIPLLAKGGNIMKSGQAIVGEAGPELIDLPQGARVTPLTDGQKGNVGLGGDTYNVNIYASDGADVVEKVDRFLEDRKRRVPLPV